MEFSKIKTLDDVIEMIDIIMQITCSGHVNFEANTKNITVESRLNSGHSLPWVSILMDVFKNKDTKQGPCIKTTPAR